MNNEFDAVSLGILWDRLISMCNEIDQTLARTSFSTIARESWDLASMLFDRQGRMLAQGIYSMPTFAGTAPQTLAHMLARFPPETLEEGDVLFTNNSWLGTGHSFDVNVARPAFRNGRIIGYAFSISHIPDIGGRGFSTLNTSMYEEGLQIPVIKIVRRGEVDRSMLELVRMNVRVPEQVIGDFMANITATQTGARKMIEFLDEYGLEDLDALSDAVIDSTEQALQRQIAALPDGVYRASVVTEGLTNHITLRCAVTVAGSSLHVDFAGSDGAVPAAYNVPFCYTRAMTAYAMKVLLLPHLPNNAGSVSPIGISAEPGSILHAQIPVATAARQMVGHNIPHMIYTAMEPALPQRVQANPAFTNILNLNGVNRDGEAFATLYFTAGGQGAMAGQDGRSVTPSPSNMRVLPTEVLEGLTGLHVEYRRMLPDSGGPGEFRGGMGQTYRLHNTSEHPLGIHGFGRRSDLPALGLSGGQAGTLRLYRIGDELVSTRGHHVLQPGESIEVFDAGGGGYGDPLQRCRADIEADLASGAITEAAARRDYGWQPA
jgi:N-methylhydantoinase B